MATVQSPPLRAGIFGAGRRGIAHARAALATGQVAVRAVYDLDGARAQALASECGATVCGSVADLLAREPLDLVCVCTPPPAHAEQTIAALRAGCHAILEKPIALTMEEARAIAAAARAAGRWVHVCHQQRYTTLADRAREWLAGRRVGLTHITLYRHQPDIPGNWDRRWGGGHVVEWAIHPLDLCRWWLGEAAVVYACYGENLLAGTPRWDNWDCYAVAMRWECGAVGALATTYAVWPGFPRSPTSLEIVADGAVLRWQGRRLVVETPRESVTYEETADATHTLHREFARAILTGDPARLRQSYDDALRTHALVLACNRANETGEPVRPADL